MCCAAFALKSGLFKIDALNGFICLGILFFAALTIIYSLKFMAKKPLLGLRQYYTYIGLTIVASLGAALANNLIVLLTFWGFLGLTLYLLISLSGPEAADAAKKTFVIVGATDCLMIFGIGIISLMSGSFQMDKISISLSGGGALATIAYICLALGALAKAGAIPVHSWVPDCAEKADLPVVAFLPASLDKLLGIYLLARITLDLFVMNTAMYTMLMVIGAVTVLGGVIMALVQHDLKRLLGFHAVSQVGYMVLGIGTGNPIGIAGGLFHMINNTIYKSCLFFAGGSVEYRKNTTDLASLGGLSKAMPITFACALIASLAISGVPPFNGFVSKWMVYQGLIANIQGAGLKFRIITSLCLVAAMFGSGLTLASFMKLMHSVFLGRGKDTSGVKEVSFLMWVPPAILAFLCIVFGIFAYQVPLKLFVVPAVGDVAFIGSWNAGLAAFLIILGMLVGLLVYFIGNAKKAVRRDEAFVGTEVFTEDERVTGVDFYNTVKDTGALGLLHKAFQKKWFDAYEQGSRLVFAINGFFRFLHNGVLPTYLVWSLIGMLVMFYVFFKYQGI
ncbi:MAG: proton-conducting transporter membrane subunit [Candidatus Omnitrophota bacterium]